ncbi:MAG: porin family protein [Burkholderiaceae bacterium]|nr:porin family protein [Burkholderiaceae bacterium]
MKKSTLAAVGLLASIIAVGAHADNGYVSADVGLGHGNISCQGATSCNNNGTSFKFILGLQLEEGFAGELGYIDFGRAGATVSGMNVTGEASGGMVGLAYLAKLNNNIGVGVRVGAARIEAKGAVAGVGSITETHTKPYFGLVGSYAITPTTHIELAFDTSKAELVSNDVTVQSIAIGVRQAF